MLESLTLFIAGFVGAVLVAIGGGGTFVTFPALLLTGLPAVAANATSAVALFPGSVTSSWAYRREIRTITEVDVRVFAVISLVGSLLGALLLLVTPSTIFARLVPWLMLFATAIFAIGTYAPRDLFARFRVSGRAALVLWFVFSIYGGFFGGGLGFLMLAALTLYGMRDVNAMNGLKLVLAMLMSVAAIGAFLLAGVVDWVAALPMLLGSVIGGHLGAHGARRLDQRISKGFIVALGTGFTLYFFFWQG